MDRATNYTELKGKIAQGFPEMSNQLQRIARFALDKPHEMALGTVAVIAEATAVQPSAMIRFANSLGYNGFSEMQQVFRSHLVERSSSYRERIEQMRSVHAQVAKQSNGKSVGNGVLHQLVGDAMSELGHLEEQIDAKTLQAAVRMLAGAVRIHVLAQRRAYPVACYIAYALSQLELRSYLIGGAGGMLAESLRAIEREDVLVVASFRNYSPEVIAAAHACHARGVRVIAITDSALSPLVASATVCFDLGDDSARPFRSLVAPLCLAQALVVSTGHHLSQKTARRPGVRAKAIAK